MAGSLMATETRNSELRAPAPPAGAAPPPAGNDEISLLDLLIVVAARRRMIAMVTAGCAVLAAIVSLLLPKEYTATAVLLPPQQNTSLASALTSQLPGLGSMAALAGGFGLKNPNDMYVAMLRSQTVEDAMIRTFDLQAEYRKRYLSDARKKFEHNSVVDGDGKDGLIRISVRDRDPKRAAELTNGYVDAFQNLSKSLAITEAGQRRLFFQKQLEQAKDDLANAEEALKQTEQTTGLIQLDSQTRALIESAASLRAQIAAKEVQIQAMRTYATGENAQLVEAQQELDSLRAELAKLGGSDESANALIVPRGQMTQSGLEYVRRLRDVKYYETIFDILARQFEIAKLDEAREGALVQVVDHATPPDKRSSPKRTLIVLGATTAGLFLSIMIALLQAGLARLREDPESSAKLALLKNMLTRRGHPLA
jgi:tyrosine-protein kinase Etk/Wzc